MKVALAGDTMLGRKVAERLAVVAPTELFSDELVAAAHEADLFVLNLECAISARGARSPDPAKPFLFRAPRVHGLLPLPATARQKRGRVTVRDRVMHVANLCSECLQPR